MHKDVVTMIYLQVGLTILAAVAAWLLATLGYDIATSTAMSPMFRAPFVAAEICCMGICLSMLYPIWFLLK